MKDHYYIDGYNFFHSYYARKSNSSRSGDLEGARGELVNFLVEFSALTGSRITIVFDGRNFKGEKDHRIGKEHNSPVRVIYAPPSTDTDSVIEALIYKEPNKERIYVISSDHALRQTCFGIGVSVMKPENFIKYFYQITQLVQLHQRYTTPVVRVETPLYEKLRILLKDIASE